MPATGAAAVRAFWGLPFLDLEGVPAAARCRDVRVVDRETGLKALHPIDLRACQVRRAERVDHDVDAVHVELVVALGRSPIEAERVLEAGAAAALNGDPQNPASPSGSSDISSRILSAALAVSVTRVGCSTVATVAS